METVVYQMQNNTASRPRTSFWLNTFHLHCLSYVSLILSGSEDDSLYSKLVIFDYWATAGSTRTVDLFFYVCFGFGMRHGKCVMFFSFSGSQAWCFFPRHPEKKLETENFWWRLLNIRTERKEILFLGIWDPNKTPSKFKQPSFAAFFYSASKCVG